MFTLGPADIVIGLGSNSSNALEMLRRARRALRVQKGFRFLGCSPIYESQALLPPDAPADWDRSFLNAACLFHVDALDSAFRSTPARQATPGQAAERCLAVLKQIERDLGRVDAPRWAPRVIDLDLLMWGGPDVKTETVTVPHREILDRPFALLPALDCVEAFNYSASAGTKIKTWRYSHPEDIPQKTKLSSVTWPEIFGVLNITPDSFSDGRPALSQADIEAKVRALVKGGASIIDVGAESTRPDAPSISSGAEIARLAPFGELLRQLRADLGFQISLDTRHPETARWALERISPDWINDVDGFSDPEMLKIGTESDCKLLVMHSRGVPPRRDLVMDCGVDPLAELLSWGEKKRDELINRGVPIDRIVLDPGIGFGKTVNQNREIVRRAGELCVLNVSILIGHSRKSFLDPDRHVAPLDRELETGIVTARLANSGIDYIRVHSPELQARALRIGAWMS